MRTVFPTLAAVFCCARVGAQCPQWDDAFSSAGPSNNVYATAVFDADGIGPDQPALYVAGEFTTAGGSRASHVARWDGASWTPLGAGVTGGETPHIAALIVFDDGTGPALYAGGSFSTAGSVGAKNVAKWNGTSWSAVGGGTDGWVSSFAVYDDASGGGADLYAGGTFTMAGGVFANHIARWTGSAWTGVGGGIDGPVSALTVQVVPPSESPDPPGFANTGFLYAGGSFAHAGSANANNVARWNGSAWNALGPGTDNAVASLHYVSTAAAGGPGLFVGGRFKNCGSTSANAIAKWNGAVWSALGSGLGGAGRPNSARTILLYDDGSGATLFVGGRFTTAGGGSANGIARWNGLAWTALGSGVNGTVRALTSWTPPGGGSSQLYVSGQFTTSQSSGASRIAKWNGVTLSPVSAGLGMSGTTRALAVFDPDGPGLQPAALYAGGEFTSAGGAAAEGIARWSGAGWTPLAGGLNGTVHALAVHDDGSGGGPALYAGGEFTIAGGVPANRIARWNGSAWSALGAGMDDTVYCLATFDAGGGSELYAGGIFATAGGVSAKSVARWTGAGWASLGQGINDEVRALAAYNDGSGNALYAGGDFNKAGTVRANNIARWNGVVWSNLGLGANGPVYALNVFDDGSGSSLYAGGVFSGMNATSADKIARWNGGVWTALNTGTIGTLAAHVAHLQTPIEGVYALTVFDEDGAGPNAAALIAGGDFVNADGVEVNHLARWNGSQWTAMSGGFDDSVFCLAVHSDGASIGPALFVGGRFTHTRGLGQETPSSRIAKWSCP